MPGAACGGRAAHQVRPRPGLIGGSGFISTSVTRRAAAASSLSKLGLACSCNGGSMISHARMMARVRHCVQLCIRGAYKCNNQTNAAGICICTWRKATCLVRQSPHLQGGQHVHSGADVQAAQQRPRGVVLCDAGRLQRRQRGPDAVHPVPAAGHTAQHRLQLPDVLPPCRLAAQHRLTCLLPALPLAGGAC